MYFIYYAPEQKTRVSLDGYVSSLFKIENILSKALKKRYSKSPSWIYFIVLEYYSTAALVI